ncbi:hypothetical protein HYPSUDRAFT_42124 [Hypholoma sublateritium FD-334 SS-4]|uniref:Nephrocystin 3-like N-terminal domain-containing protein n=1 Tax=Hypholoma sublateritium (strain FD-334 SS-4) TaxID=945553 RepID=A0A0D2NXS1_HYPSF|nr:hypothetical protein HYPSUDRAFT_42124 [Hypholoma sublateritium FD-334 SS-4]
MSIFGNKGALLVTGGTFTQHVGPSYTTRTAFERLESEVAHGAFHNSGERFDPPKCHPRTRLAVTERIMNWVRGKESTESLVMWLHGAAGAGKSAIAQRIAELCHDAEILLASYFCSRSDARRNNANSIFPTIAYQIASTIPAVRAGVEDAITRDPLIFTRSLEAQMVALVTKPLQPLIDSGFFSEPLSSPRLVIIDGLDEVLNRKEQEKILEVISNVLHRHHIPLIFLIASRPEQEISHAFSRQPLTGITARLLLDDKFHPDDDIQVFLEDSFSEIKASHPRKESIPLSWPSPDVVYKLVQKSSGQFIYAATVIRFLEAIRTRPTDQLEIVLGLRPAKQDMPFSELDALYMHILHMQSNPKKTLLIIGMLLCIEDTVYGDSIRTAAEIEQFLELDTGDVAFFLADMTSLVSCHPEKHTYNILHASFGDFLTDQSRSGEFFIDMCRMHTIMAHNCLQQINRASHYDPLMEDWGKQYPEYAMAFLSKHLSLSGPVLQPELIDNLRGISFQCLIDNLYQHSSLYRHSIGNYPLIQDIFKDILSSSCYFYDRKIEHSEYQRLQDCLIDRVITKQLDIAYERLGLSVQGFSCLLVHWGSIFAKYQWHTGISSEKWFLAAAQLTDCHIWNNLSQPNIFPSLDYHPYFSLNFFHDSTRAGKHVLDAEIYASTSLVCYRYLLHSHLRVPINITHNFAGNLSRRHNSPWKWRIHKKYFDSLRIPKAFEYALKMLPGAHHNQFLRRCLPKTYKRFKSHATHSSMTRVALTFLHGAISKSAKSDELIGLATANKPLSQHALKCPVRVKKFKAAIAAYLERVQAEDTDREDEALMEIS